MGLNELPYAINGFIIAIHLCMTDSSGTVAMALGMCYIVSSVVKIQITT